MLVALLTSVTTIVSAVVATIVSAVVAVVAALRGIVRCGCTACAAIVTTSVAVSTLRVTARFRVISTTSVRGGGARRRRARLGPRAGRCVSRSTRGTSDGTATAEREPGGGACWHLPVVSLPGSNDAVEPAVRGLVGNRFADSVLDDGRLR